jgi:two-component system copper resistance phosphate regulon response regulator CusR
MQILVIEDEEKTAASLRRGLTGAGFDVVVATRGDEGLLLAKTKEFQLVILDVMLPRRDGWEVLRRLRAAGNTTPVVYLTARDAVEDRVRGLELGADDYLVKPFAFAELIARIRTVLRRRTPPRPGRLQVADLELDLVRQRAFRRGEALGLSPKEFALLAFLAEHQGEPLSRSVIASEVWGMSVEGESNVIDVAIRRLRTKVDEPFSDELIHTVRGVGYVLDAR